MQCKWVEDRLELLLTMAVTVNKNSPMHPGVLPHISPICKCYPKGCMWFLPGA